MNLCGTSVSFSLFNTECSAQFGGISVACDSMLNLYAEGVTDSLVVIGRQKVKGVQRYGLVPGVLQSDISLSLIIL